MTPVSRAILGTKCAGIRLQIWPRSENFPAVGLRCVLFFIPRLVAGIKPVSQLFFYPKQSTPQDASEIRCVNIRGCARKIRESLFSRCIGKVIKHLSKPFNHAVENWQDLIRQD